MPISIAVETPLQDDVRMLVKALNAHLIPLSPREFQFQMTVEQMAGADTTVLVARDATGAPVGMGALKVHAADLGEVKRMYTDPDVRGQRVGSALLEAVEALALRKGIRHLVLETGEGDGFAGAYRLYERSGFVRRGVFMDYPDSAWSRFYEKYLNQDQTA